MYKLKYKVPFGLNLRLSPEYQRFEVDSARWHNWEERTHQNHVMKFWQFKPSFSDEFERPSNAERKPNFTPRSGVREALQVLVDRQRDQRDEGIRLKISKSLESNTWQSTEAENQGNNSMRFADPELCKDIWIAFTEGHSKICSAMSRKVWEVNYGRLVFGSEILLNKQMDR